MPKNDDGEFELILGNKQLLSVFFIVVILLGVFFAMGFIVGRNSPAPVMDASSVRKSDPKPLVVESAPAVSPDPTPAPVKETAVQQPDPAKADDSKAADTKAKQDAAKAEEARAKEARDTRARLDAEAKVRLADEERAKKEERARAKKEAKAEKEKAKKETANVERAKPSAGQPSGTYLQLAATTQHEAEAMVDMLRKKEFKAITAEIPEKPGTFRVLVGPVPDNAVGRSKTDLQAAGFPGDKAIKRSY